MSIYPSAEKRRDTRQTEPSHALLPLVAGILLNALGLLLLLSLGSYSPEDPQWFDVGVAQSEMPLAPPHNLIGRIGAVAASALFWVCGTAAYLMPFALMGWGGSMISDRAVRVPARGIAGTIVAGLSLSGLSHLLLPAIPVLHQGAMASGRAGGIVGRWLALSLEQNVAVVGSYIVLVTLCLVSLLMVWPAVFSVSAIGVRVGWRSCQAGGRLVLASVRTIGQAITRAKSAKPNKPVKINRASPMRGGVGSLHLEKVKKAVREQARQHEDEAFGGQAHGAAPDDPFIVMEKESVSKHYRLPSAEALLDTHQSESNRQSDEHLETQSQVLTQTLQSFGIEGKVTEIHPGPVITMYEFAPGPGIKVARIVSLADDLAMALKAHRVRVVAPLPKKSTVGIEVPNPIRETVSLKALLASESFRRSRSKLSLALGQDILGRPVIVDLRSMPHLLVAGATGSGKSVGLNCILLNILFAAHPDEVKLLLIDPKVLELQVYDGIPHLLRPVITDPKSATRGLGWVVQEMERRYRLLAEHGVRSIDAYNRKLAEQRATPMATSEPKAPVDSSSFSSRAESGKSDESSSADPAAPLPYIVVVIDEFADLMMVAPKEVEDRIARLAQMARASGIHLVLATQRPSVDVVTGLIKANFPARIAYQVSSKIDSRTILDVNGAEALLGRGDMLYMAPGSGRIVRLHGPYVSDDEVRRVVEWIKQQAGPVYHEGLTVLDEESAHDELNRDDVYEQARELVMSTGHASASFLQRRLRVGYPRAARMIEQMEEEGLVSAPARDGRREVLVRQEPVGEWSA